MLGNIKNKINSYIRNVIKEEIAAKAPKTKKVQRTIVPKEFAQDMASMELKQDKIRELQKLSLQKTIKDFVVNKNNTQLAMDEFMPQMAQPAVAMDGTAKDILYTFFSKFGFIGWQQCGILAQHWLISNACSIPAKDAIRNGWQNVFADKDKKEETNESSEQREKEQKFLTELNEISNTKFQLTAKAIQWIIKYNIYGIGIALPIIDGVDTEKPYNPDGIKKGSFKGIAVIDPYWLTPEFDMSVMTDPTNKDFFDPTYYRTNNGKRIHRSHLIIARRKEVPDILKPSYFFGGIPLTQEIYERVYASEKSANEQPLLLLTKRLNTWKIDLNEFFLNPEKYEERIRNFTDKRDNQGVLLIDHEDDLGQIDTSLSDLDQVVMSQYKLVAAVARIPVDKLFELNPSGSLSNNGDFNIKNYNQDLNTMQNDLYKPFIDRINEIVMRSYYDRKDRISIVFNPTDNPTANELAQSVKSDVDTLQTLIGSNVITTEEARQKLISNKTNGFSFLDEEAPEAEEDNQMIQQMLAQAKGQNKAQNGQPQQNVPKLQQQTKKQPNVQAQSKDSAAEDTDWITVHPKGHEKGQHVPIEEGQNKGEAIKEHFAKAKDPEHNMYYAENKEDNDDSFNPEEFDPEYAKQQQQEQEAYEEYMSKQDDELKKMHTLPEHKQILSDMGISRIRKPQPNDDRWKEYNDLSPRIKRYFFTDREGALKWDEAQQILQEHKGNDTEDIFEYLRMIDIKTPLSRTNERTRNYLKGTTEDKDIQWKEEDHPRDEKGRFAEKNKEKQYFYIDYSRPGDQYSDFTASVKVKANSKEEALEIAKSKRPNGSNFRMSDKEWENAEEITEETPSKTEQPEGYWDGNKYRSENEQEPSDETEAKTEETKEDTEEKSNIYNDIKEELINIFENREIKKFDFGELPQNKLEEINKLRQEENIELLKDNRLVIPANVVKKLIDERIINEKMSAEQLADLLLDVFHNKQSIATKTKYKHIQALIRLYDKISRLGFIAIDPQSKETVVKSGYNIKTKRVEKEYLNKKRGKDNDER